MSLIDEALKRARQDAALQDASRRDDRRVVPTPWLPAHLPRRGRSRGSLAVLAVAVCLVAAGAAATAVWWSGRKGPAPAAMASLADHASALPQSAPPSSAPAAAPVPVIEETATAAPTALAPAAPEAGLRPPQRQSPAPGTTREGVEPPPPGPSPAETPRLPSPVPAAPATSAIAPPPTPAPVAPPAPASAPPALVDGKTYVREVALPGGAKIELRGLAYSETQPVALINGKVVGPGDVVEGFTVVQIQPKRVELAANGTTIFLTLK